MMSSQSRIRTNRGLLLEYSLPRDTDSRPIAVVGAGTLGRRIALMFCTRGGEVRIFDPSAAAGAAAVDFVEDELPALAATIDGGSTGTASASRDLSTAVKGAWLVIEAAPEKLDVKVDIFRQLGSLAESDAILATNSSSFPSRLLVTEVPFPERVLNMHFFMPPGSRAIELMSSGQTSPDVIEFIKREALLFGLRPFQARKESVGFIYNRIWAAIKREALDVVAQGIATAEEVDSIWKLNTGLSLGPFRAMDQIGLDVALDIEKHYLDEYPHLPRAPRDLLQGYIDAGHLGVKSGRGFYDYAPTDDDSVAANESGVPDDAVR